MQQIEPAELRARLDRGETHHLIDVRERPEWAICRLEGAELRPMSEVLDWQEDLPQDGQPVVVYCHHGVRSARVIAYLSSLGVQDLVNLRGGVDRWRRDVDPEMPAY